MSDPDVTPTKSSYRPAASSSKANADDTNKLYRSVASSTEADADGTPLTNKLHELSISPSTETTTTEFYIFKEGQPPQQILIEVPLKPYYKPLPAGWVESEGHWVYGIPYKNSLLINFAKHYIASTGLTNTSSSPPQVLKLMGTLVGYGLSRLSIKADKKAIADGLAVRFVSGDIAVKVLILSCTASQGLFKRRPTEEQLEQLTRWFGEPRWFEDPRPKSGFPFDLLYHP